MKTQVDQGGINAVQTAGGNGVLDGFRGRNQRLYLMEDVTLTGANNFITGEALTLTVIQDQTGGWMVTWPDNFKGVDAYTVNPAANGRTEIIFAADELDNFYPMGQPIWS